MTVLVVFCLLLFHGFYTFLWSSLLIFLIFFVHFHFGILHISVQLSAV